MKIEFGCGENPTAPGFKTCDVRNLPGVDFVCNAWEIETYVPSKSVEHIFSRHFFEHLTFAQGQKFVEVTKNILQDGAIHEMMIPNLEMHIRQWLENDNIDHAKAGFWGWQRGEFTDNWDIHKSGYKFEHLKDLFLNSGFSEVKKIDSMSKHLHVIAIK